MLDIKRTYSRLRDASSSRSNFNAGIVNKRNPRIAGMRGRSAAD
jgi:hypothetical protein